MHAAVKKGSLEEVRVFIANEGRKALAVTDNTNQLPIHVAAYYNQVEILTLLCQLRSDLTARDKNGYTPLLAAAAQGSFAAAEALLRAKAPASDHSPEGSSVLHYIVRHPVSIEQKDLFVRILGLMVASGVSLEARNAQGETALHQSAVRNRWFSCRCLLNLGASINAVTKVRDTPLHYAAAGHVDVFRELIRRGADPHLEGQFGTVNSMVQNMKQQGPVRAELLELLETPPKVDSAAVDAEDVVEAARGKILVEILQTERSYNTSLGILTGAYQSQLKERQLLSAAEVTAIFSEVEAIAEFNKRLLAQLEERLGNILEQVRVGDLFVYVSTRAFQAYNTYVNNYDAAMAAVGRLRKKGGKMVVFLEEVKARPECKRLDLEALLIMPVQRIPRYVLLLRDLLRATPAKHRDYATVRDALDRLQATAEQINARKREAENAAPVARIAESLGLRLRFPLVRAYRHLRKEGKLLRIPESATSALPSATMIAAAVPMKVYLFNDIMLLAPSKKAKGPNNVTVLPLERVLVLPASPAESSFLSIEVRDAESGVESSSPNTSTSELGLAPVVVYRLASASPEERAEWAKEVSAAAAEWAAPHVECTPVERLGAAPSPIAATTAWYSSESLKQRSKGMLYLWGGYDASKVHNTGYTLDLGTRLWAELELKAPVPPARAGAAVAYAPSGCVYMHGGKSGNAAPHSDILLWRESDPNSLLVVPLHASSETPPPRSGHSLAYLTGINALLCVGGTADGTAAVSGKDFVYLCWLRGSFPDQSVIWRRYTIVGDAPSPRIDACCAALPGGLSLVLFGGFVSGIAAPAFELYVLTVTNPQLVNSASSRSLPNAAWRRADVATPSAPTRATGPYSVTQEPPALYLLSESSLANGLDPRPCLFRLDLQAISDRDRGATTVAGVWERALVDGPAGAACAQASGVIDPSSVSLYSIGGVASGGKYSSDVNRVLLTRVLPARAAMGREEDLKEATAVTSGIAIVPNASATTLNYSPAGVVATHGSSTSVSSSSGSALVLPGQKPDGTGSDTRRGSVKHHSHDNDSSAGSRIGRKVKVSDSASALSTTGAATNEPAVPLPSAIMTMLAGPDPFEPDAPHLVVPVASPPLSVTQATFSKIAEKMVEIAGESTQGGVAFLDEIIIGHRSIGSPTDLLALLLFRHRTAPSTERVKVQSKVCQVLKRWLVRVPGDWAEPSQLYLLLERYAAAVGEADPTSAQLSALLKDARAALPPPELPGALGKTTSLVLTKIDVDDMAKQLMLLESAFVKSLPLHELLDPFAPDARRVQATLGWHKRLFLWAAHETVSPMNVDDRVTALDKLIRLCARLRSQGSGLSLLFMLVLRSSPVVRLRSSWKRLKTAQHEALAELLQYLPRPSGFGGAGLPSLLYFLADMAEVCAATGRLASSTKGPNGLSNTLFNITRMRAISKSIMLLIDAPAPHGSPDKAMQDALLAGSPPPPSLPAILDSSYIREPPSNERLPRFGQTSIIAVAPFLADLFPSTPILQERDWRVLLCRARLATFTQGDVLTKEGRWPGGYLLRVKTGSVTLADAKGDKLLILPQQLLHLDALLAGVTVTGQPVVATANTPKVELWQIEPSFVQGLGQFKPRLVLRLYRAFAYLLSQRLAGAAMATRAGKAYETSLEVDGDAERHAEWEDDGAAREALSLPATDPILKRYPCLLRGSMKDEPGLFLVSASGVHFVSRSKAKKASVQWNEITAVEGAPPELTIVAGKRRIGLRELKRDPRPLFQFLSGDQNSALSPSAGRERLTLALAEATERKDKEDPKANLLSRKEWKVLGLGGRKVKLTTGEVVAREGERSTVYRVRRGVVRVERSGFVLGSVSEGHAFGEAALFGQSSPATYVAQEPVQLVECDYLYLAALPDTNPALTLRLYQQLCFSLFPIVGRVPPATAVSLGGVGAANKPGLRPQRLVNRIPEPQALMRADTRSLRKMSSSSSTELVPSSSPSGGTTRGHRTLSEVKVSPRPEGKRDT